MSETLEQNNKPTKTENITGVVISMLRTIKGISQSDAAELIGLRQSQWSRIEHGQNNLTVEQLRLVAKALGVTVFYILELVEQLTESLKD